MTALEAGQLADDYTEARRQTTKDDQVVSRPVPGTKTSSQPSRKDGGGGGNLHTSGKNDLSGWESGVETTYPP